MPTLGFDTATEVLTVAVAGGGGPLAEAEHGPAADGRPRHSALLLAGIERCVEESGGWQGIERIAVGLGPGSYTGLRIGIATARALAQARQLELRGISTLSALARGIGELPEAAGRPRLAVLDARRGQAFAELHAVGGGPPQGPVVLSPAGAGRPRPRARSRRDGGRGRGATISGGARGRRRHGRPSGGRGPQGRGAAHLRALGRGERGARGTDRAHLSERARCQEMACKRPR